MATLRTPLDALAFDQPGHGRAPDWDGAGDYHDLVSAQAAAHLVAITSARPALVIGHSFGATVALRLALEQGPRVGALVLFEPVLFAAARGDPRHDAHLRDERPFRDAMARGDHAGAVAAFVARWGEGTPFAAMPGPVRARIAAQMPLIVATAPALTEDCAGLLAPGRLETCAAPVLMLHGTRSPPVIAAIIAGLAARLPHAQVVQVPEAGHMAPMTHAGAVAALIDAWLGGVAPGL